MAQRRVCLNILRGVEAGARSASRPFSSRPHNATCSIHQQALHTPTRTLLRPPQQHTRLISAAPPSTRRPFSSTPAPHHEHLDPPKPGEELYITFQDKESHAHTFAVKAGDNLLAIATAHDHEIEMEGACGGSCACSTCHVIVTDKAMYDKMEEPDDEENDMLDLAFGLTEYSRLGCQVEMTKELDGLVVRLPSMTRNLQASDFSSK